MDEFLPIGGDRSNLVVVRAGRHSRHVAWSGPDRNYDLLVCAYEEGAPRGREDGRLLLPGRKVAGLSALFQAHPDLLDRYQRIAMIDDDIETEPQALSSCFSIGAQEGLAIWQPALKPGSYFSYAAFLQNDVFRLRYVNFIEMMCPFFESGALRRALELMDRGWETGIDTIWCRQFDQPRCRCAIIDATAVLHSRPVGLAKSANGFQAHETYDKHVSRFLDEAQTEFRGPVTYAGITLSGLRVSTRLGVMVRSLRLLNGMPHSPMRALLFYRLVLAHLRHIVSRPINDERCY